MKNIFLVFAFLFIGSISQAQILRGYGIKIGTTISNQNYDYSSSSGLSALSFDSESRVGLNIGVFAEFLNLPFISIVTEANYIQKGMKKEIPITTTTQPDGTGEFITWKTSVDYINLSAFGKLRFNIRDFSPYVLIGPKLILKLIKRIHLTLIIFLKKIIIKIDLD